MSVLNLFALVLRLLRLFSPLGGDLFVEGSLLKVILFALLCGDGDGDSGDDYNNMRTLLTHTNIQRRLQYLVLFLKLYCFLFCFLVLCHVM